MSEEEPPLLAVAGCTGESGSRVLKALRRVYPDDRIRCIVRRGTDKPLEHLEGTESVRHVDYLDASSLAEALEGVRGAYLVTPPSPDALAMRKNMAEACSSSASGSLRHVVMMGEAIDISWFGFGPYWDDLKEGENQMQRTGIPLTVLHPSYFAEGFATHFGNPQTIIAEDYFSRVGNPKVSYTSLEDVAEVATKALREGPEIHGWKSYNMITAVLTGDEVAECLTKALGRKIEYRPITVEQLRDSMVQAGAPDVFVEAYTKCLAMTVEGHFTSDDRGQLRELLGRKPLTMVEALRNVGHLLSKDSQLERASNK